MNLIAAVTGIIVLQYFVFVMMAGAIRGKSGIQAPAMTGDARLERMLRVQMNTLEQMVIVIPSMWLFGTYINEMYAASLGAVFVIARVLYCRGYLKDPSKRAIGFGLGMLATIMMLAGGLYGAIMAAI
ncbi:MAPEG family protein [uncultured Oceanicoccus sp.]|uniref:MAPEG family protein n=1 Tax=uncultured Oceanicoccus sp. TaxID=1706381 RepID=UPI0030D6D568